MKIINCIQGSDEWLEARLGKFTGSDFHTLMGNSQAKKTILFKKAAERITRKRADACNFSNIHTDRGHELEEEARTEYSIQNLTEVKEVGFIELHETVGCSPDGLVENDGGLEIKCKDNHTHLQAILNDYVEPAHKTQCQFNMYVTGRSWWDYALYNPNFTEPLHNIRIGRDDEYIEKIIQCIKECNEIIESHIKSFQNLLTT